MHPFQFPTQKILDPICLGVVVLDSFLPLFQVVLIVTFININGPVVHLHHGVRHGIQKITVVGHHQKGAAGVGQIVLQKLDAVYIQMVRRLVHHEKVRLAGKHHDDGRTLDLTSGKYLHLTVIFRHPEGGQKAANPLLIFSKMLRIKVLRPRFAVPHNLIPHCGLGVIFILLFKECDADVLEEYDLAAGVGAIFAGEDAQEAGLAGAVRGDKCDLVAFVDVEADVFEQDLGPVGLGDVLYLEVTWHIQKYSENKNNHLLRKYLNFAGHTCGLRRSFHLSHQRIKPLLRRYGTGRNSNYSGI